MFATDTIAIVGWVER